MNLTRTYTVALAVLLGLSLAACGGGSQPEPATAEAHAAPRSLHTGRVLIVGGNEVMVRAGGRWVPRDYGPCVDNDGIVDGDSTGILGAFQLGILNAYPSRVIIVANAFELTYAERQWTLDNLTGAVVTSVVSGARVTLVGVPGSNEFNAQLRSIAVSYGAEYADAVGAITCP